MISPRPIGGFFELEISPRRSQVWPGSQDFNAARFALAHHLKVSNVKNLWLPDFICDSVAQGACAGGSQVRWYPIGPNLETETIPPMDPSDRILLVNYFGLKQRWIRSVIKRIGANRCIVDNAQAYFTKPFAGVANIYSPRKFFGLPDGGLLYSPNRVGISTEPDNSSFRFRHLVGRRDVGPQLFLDSYREAEGTLTTSTVRVMSATTRNLLDAINARHCAAIRSRNFWYLHRHLKHWNMLPVRWDVDTGPMVYPFLPARPGLRERLHAELVFVARYWPEVPERNPASAAAMLARDLIPLPIDQRYSLGDMSRIASIIRSFYG